MRGILQVGPTCDFLVQNNLSLALSNDSKQAPPFALQPPLVTAVDQPEERVVIPLQGLQGTIHQNPLISHSPFHPAILISASVTLLPHSLGSFMEMGLLI